ncbi:PEP-CTERM/exosortase system-associated acyltransferase [Rheinheimera muenzenbergensis]|uniref:PEP-CTERM/exosortase system-associated acyltransferase n=1 Tax=Rheinheimera muenzenbergensis TaxID=1193628 RepID=A0ABU8CAK1_9GAMM
MNIHLATGINSPLYVPKACPEFALGLDPSVACFLNSFHCFAAESVLEKNAVYRLRHKVYCEELNFEPIRENGMESDSFDTNSMHLGIEHALSAKMVGTVRVITSANSQELLPVESNFGNTITHAELNPGAFQREQICEISRLAVPDFVRCKLRSGDMFTDEQQAQSGSLVAISLYLLASVLCEQEGRFHCFVMFEHKMARALRKIGIHFSQVGDFTEYHGLRAVHYLDVRTLNETLKPKYLALRSMLATQLDSNSLARLGSKKIA